MVKHWVTYQEEGPDVVRCSSHKAISPGSTDYQQWAARILDDTEFPQYPGPKILIKGNSRDFWVRNLGRYHDNPNGPNCVATKLKHREAYFAIIEDPERQCTYWIIVLPQHNELDNSVLAGDDKEVPTEMLPIRIVHADIDQTKKRREALRANNVEIDEDEDEDTDLPDGMLGMVLFWRILIRGSARRDNRKQRKKNVLDLFTSP